MKRFSRRLSFYRWRDWGPEGVRGQPEVTELIISKALRHHPRAFFLLCPPFWSPRDTVLGAQNFISISVGQWLNGTWVSEQKWVLFLLKGKLNLTDNGTSDKCLLGLGQTQGACSRSFLGGVRAWELEVVLGSSWNLPTLPVSTCRRQTMLEELQNSTDLG